MVHLVDGSRSTLVLENVAPPFVDAVLGQQREEEKSAEAQT
jgi:hypothetical protein